MAVEPSEWDVKGFDSNIKDIIREAICIHKDNLKIAKHIKDQADELYGAPHHCIVGKNFIGFATQVNHAQCNYGDLKVYLYKSPRYYTSIN